jgi:hypothetical protein
MLFNERSPRFLRIVVDAKGGVDCLDQLEDAPERDEEVHVYERVPGSSGDFGFVILARPKRCIKVPLNDYRHRADVDGQALRETGAWREWCQAQPPADG